jgi:hypothetical protein
VMEVGLFSLGSGSGKSQPDPGVCLTYLHSFRVGDMHRGGINHFHF